MPTAKTHDAAHPDDDPADDESGAPPFAPDAPAAVSKTQLKKASHDLQDLGEALAKLPDDRLDALALPESLRDAVRELRRTRSHEGRRRQIQYIGKLMRRAEAEPIRQALAQSQLGSARETLALHQAERWRAELIADDGALTRWMTEHPRCDLPQLRALVRNARKDAALAPEQRSGRAYRELFQYIKQSRGDDADA